MNNWYLYRHIRLDKNEPFYIGIGCMKDYARAYSKQARNKHWKSIVAKSDYDVEILMDGITKEQAVEKEKEFILLYGRRDLGTGTLVNMTDGGDGGSGMKHSEHTRHIIGVAGRGRIKSPETREKLRIANTGKKLSIEHICKLRSAKTGKKQLRSTIDAMRAANIGRKRPIETVKKISKPVLVYEYKSGEFIGEWFGLKEACRALGIKSTGGASMVASGLRSHTNGYILKYIQI